jgi:23S rRNA (pseudouridine1915-N3)-methyltransferase
MKITFVTVSSRLPPWLSELTADYAKRISFWVPSELVVLSSSSHGRDALDRKKNLESETLLSFFKPDDFVVVCDERGKAFDTAAFAKKLENILNGGKKRLMVVVGGAYGVNEGVKDRADLMISLSSFTTTHHMALAIICEQTYRAMTILKNVKYHNE